MSKLPDQEPQVVPPEEAFARVIDSERAFLQRNTSVIHGYHGSLPAIRLSEGTGIIDKLQQLIAEKDRVHVLDLGAGDDAALWTGGAHGDGVLPEIQALQESGKLTITAHSGRGPLVDWSLQHGIDRFLTGHFVDAIAQLRAEGVRFDVITSRFALYQTAAALSLLPEIDELLSNDGTAFLDTVNRFDNEHIFLYPPGEAPTSYDTSSFFPSLAFGQAQVGGVTWGVTGDQENVAWRKGEFDSSKLPRLTAVIPATPDSRLVVNTPKPVYMVTTPLIGSRRKDVWYSETSGR